MGLLLPFSESKAHDSADVSPLGTLSDLEAFDPGSGTGGGGGPATADYLGGGSNSEDGSGNTIAASYSPSNTVHSLLVAEIAWASNATLASVTDTAGNTWHLIGSPVWDTNDQSTQLAYAEDAVGGANTVTATLAAGASRLYRRIILSEYSGVVTSGALDQWIGQAQANNTTANNVTSGATGTLAQADELVVSGTMDVNNGANVLSAGTGYTKRLEAGLAALEDKQVSSTAPVSGTWTYGTAGRAITHVATFKIASTGGGGTPGDATSTPATTGRPYASAGQVAAAVALAGLLATTGAPYAPMGTVTAGTPAAVTSEPATTGRAVAPDGQATAGASTSSPPAVVGRPYAPSGAATVGATATSTPAVTGRPYAPSGVVAAASSATSLPASTGTAYAPMGDALGETLITLGGPATTGRPVAPSGAAAAAAGVTSSPAVVGRPYAPAGTATGSGAADSTSTPAVTGRAVAPTGTTSAGATATSPAAVTGRPYSPSGAAAGAAGVSGPAATVGRPYAPQGAVSAASATSSSPGATGAPYAPAGSTAAGSTVTSTPAVTGRPYAPAGVASSPAAATSAPATTGRPYAPVGIVTAGAEVTEPAAVTGAAVTPNGVVTAEAQTTEPAAVTGAAYAPAGAAAAVGLGENVIMLGFNEHQRLVLFGEHQRSVTFDEHQRSVTYRYTQEIPMQINPHSRELYDPRPATDPAVDPADWEASFDNGLSWHPAAVLDNQPTWLLAGVSVEKGAAVAVITDRTEPIIRAISTPEVIARRGPEITIYD